MCTVAGCAPERAQPNIFMFPSPAPPLPSNTLKRARGRNDTTRMWLLFANQTENDILLREELEAIAADHPERFHLWFTIDRSVEDGWEYDTGCGALVQVLPVADCGIRVKFAGFVVRLWFEESNSLPPARFPV